MTPAQHVSAFILMSALASANAMEITGLRPGAPVAFNSADVQVHGHTLILSRDKNSSLVVAPWPDFLPRHFPKMTVSGERRLDPGGPSDRIALNRERESKPFVIIANGARANSPIVGGWRLMHTKGQWRASTRTGGCSTIASAGATLKINDGNDQWLVHILEVAEPEKKAAMANETIPNVSWVAVRTLPRKSR